MEMQSLFTQISFETFAIQYWGLKEYWQNLPHDEISELLSWEYLQEQLKNPKIFDQVSIFLRSSNFEIDVPAPNSLEKILEGLANGYTLQIRKLENILPPHSTLMSLVKSLEKTILQPLDSITFFYSHPHSMPTAIHKDIGEIFSLQLSGKKRWKIATEKCLTEQMCFKEIEFPSWNSYTLSAGHFMYLPSYLPHQVKCVDESSASVAFVFRNIQRENIISYLSEDPDIKAELMKPLPMIDNSSLQNNAQAWVQKLMDLYNKKSQEIGTKKIMENIFKHVQDYLDR